MIPLTVLVPDDLKEALSQVATETERTEDELVLEAIRRTVNEAKRPLPRIPLTKQGLGDPTAAERVDQLLRGGFGRK